MQRGEIWLVSLEATQNSIQNGIRPIVITSNNMANTYSSVIHGCPITSRSKSPLPTHVEIDVNSGLLFRSTALCEQTMLIPKNAFIKQVGMCDAKTQDNIDLALSIQFGLASPNKTEKIIS